MSCFFRGRVPPYSKLAADPVAADPVAVDPVAVATAAIARLSDKELWMVDKGNLVPAHEVCVSFREAEGALVAAGLLAPSSCMRTRYTAELVRLCSAGIRLDDPRSVRCWKYQ